MKAVRNPSRKNLYEGFENGEYGVAIVRAIKTVKFDCKCNFIIEEGEIYRIEVLIINNSMEKDCFKINGLCAKNGMSYVIGKE